MASQNIRFLEKRHAPYFIDKATKQSSEANMTKRSSLQTSHTRAIKTYTSLTRATLANYLRPKGYNTKNGLKQSYTSIKRKQPDLAEED